MDKDFVLNLADSIQAVTNPSTPSSVHELREVVRRLGNKHRDQIYLRCMEGLGREASFREFVMNADRVQTLADAELGKQRLRQSVVGESLPWAVGVVRLFDSGCGVRDRYDNFMGMLAVKSGGKFHAAPLKGIFRLSEKLWLRPTDNPEPHKPFFPRGDCANVFDVVRGMIACANMDVMNMCLALLTACDVRLWHRDQAARGVNILDEDLTTAAEAAGITEKLKILRVKNRLRRPTSSGWADVMIKCVAREGEGARVCNGDR